ncbi:MAG: hypothetical protein LBU65_08130 [Planctomycetaceae bacterium]|jgi:hypothetical protein|nr:hypothetical protein [Planctomycetaceae bacterium]
MLENVKSKSQVARVQKVNQLIKRGDWKQAYKETRFLYKTCPDSELEQLMGLSLWNWIKNQVAKNQLDDAKTNAKELLQIKVLSYDILSEMPAVFVRLGMNSMLPDDLKIDTKSPEIQVTLVDQFLVNNVKSKEIDAANLAEAELVLQSLQLVEQKRDDDALELLRPVSFKSPLAEWRLLVRGLVAHYKNDYENRDEAWKRLSDKRPPYKIAAGVCAISEQKNKPNDGSSSIWLSFFSLFNDTTKNNSISNALEIINSLKQLADYKSQNRSKELIGRYNSVRELLKSFSPEIFERVKNIVWAHLFHSGNTSVMKQFVERNLPLPLDPRGNRTLALCSNSMKARNYFFAFLRNDIDIIEEFSPEMKARTRGILLLSIATGMVGEFDEYPALPGRKPTCCERCIEEWKSRTESWKDSDNERVGLEIEKYCNEAIAADPTFIDAYEFAKLWCIAAKNNLWYEEEVIKLDKKLLDNVPDHLPTLIEYVSFCINNGHQEDCAEYYERILKLDPISRQTMFVKLQYLTALARFQIDKQRFDDAAKTIAVLSNVRQDLVSYQFEMELVGLQFSLAALSGDEKDAIKIIDNTVGSRFEKRITALFAALIEGTKRNVSTKILAAVQTEWEKELTKNCNGNAAGTMGSLIGSIGVNDKLDVTIEKLFEKAMKFVSRSSGIKKWNSERDLIGICQALRVCMVRNTSLIDEYRTVFQKQASTLHKLFPESPFANFYYAESLLTKTGYGEYNSKVKAKDIYRKVLDLCKHNSRDIEIKSLTGLAELRLKVERRFPKFEDWDGIGKHSYSQDVLDDDDDDFESDEDVITRLSVATLRSIVMRVKVPKLRNVLLGAFRLHNDFDLIEPEEFLTLLQETFEAHMSGLTDSEISEFEQFMGSDIFNDEYK